jgi:aldehyde dehydrogenase (NAD+)
VTAFNFPVAVWAWNLALALVCGDTVVWKPSSKTPLSAIFCTRLAARVLTRNGYPPAVASLLIGPGKEIGDRLIEDPRVALVSYTGSAVTGQHVGVAVQRRFGRSILELGGNAAVVVSEKADLEQALEAVHFGVIGTSGQRCTSTRRVIVHESVMPRFLEGLLGRLERTWIGDPRDPDVLMGPLVDRTAVDAMMAAIAAAEQQGGIVLYGGVRLPIAGGCYVTPCVIKASNDLPIVQQETFAPILYVMPYTDLDQAIALQNGVPQGLSSAIFTRDLLEAERFTGPSGSDCGLANVNAGTVGAEIGGAFGGEKETGGGREAGSDAWKAYMRRQTSVINGSGRIELAQGIRLSV